MHTQRRDYRASKKGHIAGSIFDMLTAGLQHVKDAALNAALLLESKTWRMPSEFAAWCFK